MSRASRAEAQRHRQQIEEASARLFRERGLSVSVADLMSEVGLTHGGFYGHFDSKDALAAIAMARAFEETAARWRARLAGADAADGRAALFRGYLHPDNRNVPAHGCPLVALATDVAREPADKPVRAAYLKGLASLLEILERAQPADDHPAQARHDALVQMCLLVGAMALARATNGQPLSDELLQAARRQLVENPPAGGRQPG